MNSEGEAAMNRQHRDKQNSIEIDHRHIQADIKAHIHKYKRENKQGETDRQTGRHAPIQRERLKI